MDPKTHASIITTAEDHATELELAPDELAGEVGRLEVAADREGGNLILTATEAALLTDARVKTKSVGAGVEHVYGERTIRALERLGRLRARRLEELARPVDVADLRRAILELIAEELDDAEMTASGVLAELARAWRDLGTGPVDLLPAVGIGSTHVAGPFTHTIKASTGITGSAPVTPGLDEVSAKRLAGHVYQAVAVHRCTVRGDQAELAEAARRAVLEGLDELKAGA